MSRAICDTGSRPPHTLAPVRARLAHVGSPARRWPEGRLSRHRGVPRSKGTVTRDRESSVTDAAPFRPWSFVVQEILLNIPSRLTRLERKAVAASFYTCRHCCGYPRVTIQEWFIPNSNDVGCKRIRDPLSDSDKERFAGWQDENSWSACDLRCRWCGKAADVVILERPLVPTEMEYAGRLAMNVNAQSA